MREKASSKTGSQVAVETPEGQGKGLEAPTPFEPLAGRRIPRDRLVRVRSAVPLTEEEKSALRGKITRRFGHNLEFQFEVDESILGGVVVRVGDKVIDGSVAGKLAALRESLKAAS